MITAAVIGTGVVAVAGASAVTAGAGAYLYKRKQRRKAKKKKAQKEQIVFGQHLEEVTRLSENELPEVFDFTISWLEQNGLGVDDLFNTARNPMRAGELARDFDGSTGYPDFTTEDPRDVSLLLVRYLGDLPEPLCTFVLYDEFIQIEEEENAENWNEAMRSQLLQLPDINLRVSKRLLKFLCLYCTEQQRVHQVPTERSVDSLSKIFGRLMFHNWDTESAGYNTEATSQSIFAKLLLNYDRIFSTSNRLSSTPGEFSPFATVSSQALNPSNSFNRSAIPEFDGTEPNKSSTISLEKDESPASSSISLDKVPVIDSKRLSKPLPKPPGMLPRPPSRLPSLPHVQHPSTDYSEDSSVCELDIDTYSSPELEIMCGEVRSEIAGISLEKSDSSVYRSDGGSASRTKPLPPPPGH